MAEDIFADEWRECLQAHYMHVVRTNDRVTLPSLTLVMHQANFSESELAELRVRATMRVDEVDEDFVPDLDILEAAEQGAESDASAPSVPEVAVFALPEVPEALEDALPDDAEDMVEPDALPEPAADDVPEDDPDAPQQLSLF